MASWYYADKNDRQIEIEESMLSHAIGKGEITPDTLVWTEDMSEWEKAATVLAGRFPSRYFTDFFYYLIGGVHYGPVSSSELEKLLHDGVVTPETLVYRAGSGSEYAERIETIRPEIIPEYWFYSNGEALSGRISPGELARRLPGMVKSPRSLLWRQGSTSDWKHPSMIPEIVEKFGIKPDSRIEGTAAKPDSPSPELQNHPMPQRTFRGRRFFVALLKGFCVAFATGIGTHFAGWLGGVFAASLAGAFLVLAHGQVDGQDH